MPSTPTAEPMNGALPSLLKGALIADFFDQRPSVYLP